MKSMRRQLGFTLVEVLIVIAILAILIGIFLPTFVRARFKGYHAGCLENMHNLQTAMEVYNLDYQMYPGALTDLTINGHYMLTISDCPSVPGLKYTSGYEVSSDNKNYTISCPGVHHAQLDNVRNGYPQVTAQGSLMGE